MTSSYTNNDQGKDFPRKQRLQNQGGRQGGRKTGKAPELKTDPVKDKRTQREEGLAQVADISMLSTLTADVKVSDSIQQEVGLQ